MFKNFFATFWPSFFLFLTIVFATIAHYRGDLMDRAINFLGWYLMLAGYIILALALIAAGVVIHLITAKRRTDANRPVDGAFPLQRHRLKGGRTLIINPNTMISPAAIVDPITGYQEWEHPAGWDIVAHIRELVERANMIRAIFPGDRVRTDKYGAMSEAPRPNEATMKMLDPRKPPLLPPTPGRPLGPLPSGPLVSLSPCLPGSPLGPLSSPDPITAITNAPIGAVALGYTTTGAIIYYRRQAHAHSRWHGTTQGSGKTNGAKTALVGFLRQGCHVVIADRRRFKDFGAFDGKAEFVDTSDPHTFILLLRRLEKLYRDRDTLLGHHRAPNIDRLPIPVIRYHILITEFGTHCSVAQEAGLLDKVTAPLSRIMREAGAAGIHLMFEDQTPIKGSWPRGVAANASGIFTGLLPANQGQAGGYHHAHHLKPYQFHHDGEIFTTWNMETYAPQLLAGAPPYDPRFAVIDGQAATVSAPPLPAAKPFFGGLPGAATTVYTIDPNTPDEPLDEDDNAPTNKWQAVTLAFFQQHPAYLTGPPQGINDLARAMATAEGAGKPHTAYKGIAHTYYHNFRKNVRLPSTGQPLGVDISTQEP